MPVLYGVFLFMGVSSLKGIQVTLYGCILLNNMLKLVSIMCKSVLLALTLLAVADSNVCCISSSCN